MSLIKELTRRNVFRVMLTYAVAAWLLQRRVYYSDVGTACDTSYYEFAVSLAAGESWQRHRR